MPVRVKAREGIDKEREWEDLRRAVVEVLCSGKAKGVGVIMRDETGARRLTVKEGEGSGPWEVAVLNQVYGIDVGGKGWERVKAKQNGVRIEGWICERGVAGRGWQYICWFHPPFVEPGC
jgi:DNA mismatch repair protein MLH3